ncbi:thermonuclease family protein [Macrococcus capreoli]|uniref:thermonuclease family protein n=1 Tax=Macrococcus capreoli TaxID=2982690 RepID=UPI0021D5FF41|nr:thermonuclease family protein [Macrococcus sp. TMW 2.2395]MCU7557008.1 thermonuclease family protein [Macrococcus sp. TMW 2.2395]
MKQVLKCVIAFIFVLTLIPFSNQAKAASNLLISEYVEGSSYNKAIEIYNPGNTAVDLSSYSLVSFTNGADRTTGTVTELKLSGTIEAKSTYVIANKSASEAVLSKAQMTTGNAVMNFNGDDTLVLFQNYDATTKNGEVQDAVGQIGVDPGTNFGTDVSTLDMTLVRTNDLLTPDTNIEDAYHPEKQFIALPKDTFDQLGRFDGGVVAPPAEVAKDQYQVKVLRVVDGDTIKISPAIMGSDTIRFVNIDTAETYHLTSYDESLIKTDLNQNQKYFGELAKKALNEKLTPGMDITVKVNKEHVTDDYGRVLGQVIRTSDNVNVNLSMVKEGFASTYFIWPVMSMEDYNMFQSAVKAAQDAGLGMWNKSNPQLELPFEFRARYDGKGLLRYVGNSDTKVFYDPQNFAQVPVDKRIFFSKEEAIAQGYKPAAGNGEGEITVEPAKAMDIDAARKAGKGTNAIVTGTVTHIDGYNIYIQDKTGGIVVRSKTVKPNIGDVIEATGETGEYFGLYQIESEEIKVTGQSNITPEKKTLSSIGESEEAELITINDVTVKSVNEHSEYTVEDKSGHTFMIKAKSGIEVGKTYHAITGVVTFSYDNYKLLPTEIVEKEIVKETPKTVSGIAFLDKNHNGKYDRPDLVLKNVKVSIYKDNQLVEEVVTDEFGAYNTLLLNGNYTLKFEVPNGLVETFENNADENVDSDISDGKVDVVINNQDVQNISAGYTKPVGKMKRK